MRSFLFNILFYGSTAIACFAYLPLLVLPRPLMRGALMAYLRWVHFIESRVLGLDYRVVGAENLPAHGPYLVAMKHQSAYETMKIHLLFHDPAVILKRELLWIPLWGWFAMKMRMIAVDRGARGKAIASIITGAKRTIAQGRSVVIFPQGTRVAPDVGADVKPYKVGIYKLYESLNLPVVPVALNSGQFWGRKAVTKRGGVVTFQILPAIETGLPQTEFMRRLETDIETATKGL